MAYVRGLIRVVGRGPSHAQLALELEVLSSLMRTRVYCTALQPAQKEGMYLLSKQ